MKKQHNDLLTWCEIDLKAVKNNLKVLKKCAEKNKFQLPTRPRKKGSENSAQILAVIKADAYGLGIERIAKLLVKEKVDFLGVSDVKEGIRLRKIGIKKPILLFESTLKQFAKQIVDYKLTPTICTMSLAQELNRYALKTKKQVDIHVKVDTGMGRLGVWHEGAQEFIFKLHRLKQLRIMGIFTHFPAADSDKNFTQKQMGHLYDLVTSLDKKGLVIPYIHAANSMGLAGYQTHILNLARPGLMLYGLYPHWSLQKKVKLKPALSVYSRIIFVKDVEKGRSISYGRTFLTKRKMKIATIPIGYNDGYFRILSNKSEVLIGRQRCQVVGRVTMDQIMVDVTHIKNVREGDPVVILGKQGKEEITADELADLAQTINYEIICSLGSRLPRIYQ